MSRTIRRKGSKECYWKGFYEEDLGKEKGDARYHSDMGIGREWCKDPILKSASSSKTRRRVRDLLSNPVDNEDQLVATDSTFRKEAGARWKYSM